MDLLPVLEGRAPEVSRTLFWRTGNPAKQQWAVRSGDWKLVLDGGSPFVFNVRKDVGERENLTNQRQEVARRLWPLLDAWEKDVDAEWKASGVNAPSTPR